MSRIIIFLILNFIFSFIFAYWPGDNQIKINTQNIEQLQQTSLKQDKDFIFYLENKNKEIFNNLISIKRLIDYAIKAKPDILIELIEKIYDIYDLFDKNYYNQKNVCLIFFKDVSVCENKEKDPNKLFELYRKSNSDLDKYRNIININKIVLFDDDKKIDSINNINKVIYELWQKKDDLVSDIGFISIWKTNFGYLNLIIWTDNLYALIKALSQDGYNIFLWYFFNFIFEYTNNLIIAIKGWYWPNPAITVWIFTYKYFDYLFYIFIFWFFITTFVFPYVKIDDQVKHINIFKILQYIDIEYFKKLLFGNEDIVINTWKEEIIILNKRHLPFFLRFIFADDVYISPFFYFIIWVSIFMTTKILSVTLF